MTAVARAEIVRREHRAHRRRARRAAAPSAPRRPRRSSGSPGERIMWSRACVIGAVNSSIASTSSVIGAASARCVMEHLGRRATKFAPVAESAHFCCRAVAIASCSVTGRTAKLPACLAPCADARSLAAELEAAAGPHRPRARGLVHVDVRDRARRMARAYTRTTPDDASAYFHLGEDGRAFAYVPRYSYLESSRRSDRRGVLPVGELYPEPDVEARERSTSGRGNNRQRGRG